MLSEEQVNTISDVMLKSTGKHVYEDWDQYEIKTGFKQVDASLTNKRGLSAIRSSSTYLIAGLEKSGKTAFSLNLISNLLLNRRTVGLISTEMTLGDVTDRLITIRGADKDDEKMIRLNTELEMYFNFIGKGDPQLYKDNKLSLEACVNQIGEWKKEATSAVFFDNITSFSSSMDGNKKGWEIQAASMQKLGNLASELKIILFLIIHTKNTSLAVDTKRIESIIKSDDPGAIFKTEVTVVRRPALADCYGGGAAQSQIMGAFLIWRPFQKFGSVNFKSKTALILESWRYADSGNLIEFNFDLETGKWTEIELKDDEWEKAAVNILEN